MRALGPTILAVTLVATAGCGSNGGSNNTASSSAAPSAAAAVPSPTAAAPSSGAKKDIAAITKLAKAIETGKAATVCKTMLTPAMVKTVFGTTAGCIASDDGDDDPTTGATVASVQVSGDTATARVTDKGGSTDGAGGTWHFERSGKAWKLAQWGVDYLRAQFTTGFGANYAPDGADDPFADTGYRQCIVDAFHAADDATVQTVAYGLQKNQNTKTGQLFASCSAKAPGGQSPFRATFEKGLRDEFHAFGAPAEAADCVIDKLRTAIPESNLINAVLNGTGSKELNKVSATVGTATAACAKGSAGSHPTIRAPKHKYAIRPLH